jgi:hypothetical protein
LGVSNDARDLEGRAMTYKNKCRGRKRRQHWERVSFASFMSRMLTESAHAAGIRDGVVSLHIDGTVFESEDMAKVRELLADGRAHIISHTWEPSPGEVSWPMTIVPWPTEGTS